MKGIDNVQALAWTDWQIPWKNQGYPVYGHKCECATSRTHCPPMWRALLSVLQLTRVLNLWGKSTAFCLSDAYMFQKRKGERNCARYCIDGRRYSIPASLFKTWWLVDWASLVDLQLDAQNCYLFTYNTFIKILYMFRALPCSSSGGLRRNCIYAVFGIVTLCRRLSSFLTGAQDSHLQTVTIPEAAYIQLWRRPPENEQGNARNMQRILINVVYVNKILMQKWGERIFSNRQLGMRVYIRIVMIMGLE